jgi:hypothetical protein
VPSLKPIARLPARVPQLLRIAVLELAAAKLGPALGLLDDLGRRVLLGLGVDGDEHLLDAAQVRDGVFGEAACQEGTCCVAPGEEVVAAAWAVGGGRARDIVDGAVDGEVDGLGWVAAVVGLELCVGEVDVTALRVGCVS